MRRGDRPRNCNRVTRLWQVLLRITSSCRADHRLQSSAACRLLKKLCQLGDIGRNPPRMCGVRQLSNAIPKPVRSQEAFLDRFGSQRHCAMRPRRSPSASSPYGATRLLLPPWIALRPLACTPCGNAVRSRASPRREWRRKRASRRRCLRSAIGNDGALAHASARGLLGFQARGRRPCSRLRYARRRKRGIQTCKGRASCQIATLSERAA
jgi:hypothetical protein